MQEYFLENSATDFARIKAGFTWSWLQENTGTDFECHALLLLAGRQAPGILVISQSLGHVGNGDGSGQIRMAEHAVAYAKSHIEMAVSST